MRRFAILLLVVALAGCTPDRYYVEERQPVYPRAESAEPPDGFLEGIAGLVDLFARET